MSANDRLKQKGRRESGTFVLLPHAVLNSPALIHLSANAKRLFLDLCSMYRYGHNGDISCSRTVMGARGWRSHSALAKALAELLDAGLLQQTRQGGRNRCALYAFTWVAIDECGGKLDVPSTRVASGLWRLRPVPRLSSVA